MSIKTMTAALKELGYLSDKQIEFITKYPGDVSVNEILEGEDMNKEDQVSDIIEEHLKTDKSEFVTFDVCCDYSLDPVSPDFKGIGGGYVVKHKEIQGIECEFYFHKKYGELHYCKAPASFKGMIV